MTPAELRDALEIERNTARKELARVEAERDAALAQAVALRGALELAHTRLRLAAWADKTMEDSERDEDEDLEPSGILELNQAVLDKIEAALAAPAPRVYTREEFSPVIHAIKHALSTIISWNELNGYNPDEQFSVQDLRAILARLDAEGEAHNGN